MIKVIPISERGEPIAISGTDLYGRALSLPTASPGATLLNVWWSGCAECRAEAPKLRALATGRQKIGNVYGIDIRESGRQQAQRFQEHYGSSYPSFYDPGGKVLLAFRGRVPYTAIPTTIVLDRDMRVAAIILGVIPSVTTMKDVVSEALAS